MSGRGKDFHFKHLLFPVRPFQAEVVLLHRRDIIIACAVAKFDMHVVVATTADKQVGSIQS
ncbi:MAG: hypothetical protein RIQ71_966 [Verrucomicrobiota bacterium]|jgi:hypothetical protein